MLNFLNESYIKPGLYKNDCLKDANFSGCGGFAILRNVKCDNVKMWKCEMLYTSHLNFSVFCVSDEHKR